MCLGIGSLGFKGRVSIAKFSSVLITRGHWFESWSLSGLMARRCPVGYCSIRIASGRGTTFLAPVQKSAFQAVKPSGFHDKLYFGK